jgi:hypothetical protein
MHVRLFVYYFQITENFEDYHLEVSEPNRHIVRVGWSVDSTTYSTHQTIRYTPLFSMHSYGTTCPRKNAITLEPLGLDFFPFGPE